MVHRDDVLHERPGSQNAGLVMDTTCLMWFVKSGHRAIKNFPVLSILQDPFPTVSSTRDFLASCLVLSAFYLFF